MLISLFAYTHKSIEYKEGKLLSTTGAPGERSCAESNCHVTNQSSEQVELLMPGNDYSYTPGKKYILTLTLGDAKKSNAGFQVVTLNEENQQSVGKMMTFEDQIGSIIGGTESFPAREYLSLMPEDHYQSSKNGIYHFIWEAPFMDQGDVQFFISGVAADMDGSNNGDIAFRTSIVLNPANQIATDEKTANPVFIYPTFIKNEINFEFSVSTETGVNIKIYDLTGSIAETVLDDERMEGNYTEKYFLKNNLQDGIYLVVLQIGEETTSQKIMISK